MSQNSNVERIATLETQVTELTAMVTALLDEVATMKSVPAVATRQVRNIDARNMTVMEVREIFQMAANGMSGYKIAKTLGKNAPYIYNILNRKIYADVNVSDIVSGGSIVAPAVVETEARPFGEVFDMPAYDLEPKAE